MLSSEKHIEVMYRYKSIKAFVSQSHFYVLVGTKKIKIELLDLDPGSAFRIRITDPDP